MMTVALIGGDGSGKSSLAELLLTEFPLPMKRIYMGANLESSNYALPWSRLALKIKKWRLARMAQRHKIVDPAYATTHHMAHRQRPTGLLRTVLRLANRLLEVVYRHLVSWGWQRRGYHVVYDRHFLFDTFLEEKNGRFPPTPSQRVNQLYYWLLRHLFPLPDIIIFLQATPEVMVRRKQEATVAYLRERNAYWLRQGRAFPNFVCINADQPLRQVYEETAVLLLTYHHTHQIIPPTDKNN